VLLSTSAVVIGVLALVVFRLFKGYRGQSAH